MKEKWLWDFAALQEMVLLCKMFCGLAQSVPITQSHLRVASSNNSDRKREILTRQHKHKTSLIA